ncbi:hypothetical protein [Chitinophaga flava]|nr:hypothetical protein [Chitinophaga flava]
MDADIVLLKADPHADSRHFDQEGYTIRNRKIIYNDATDRQPAGDRK